MKGFVCYPVGIKKFWVCNLDISQYGRWGKGIISC